jgi:acetolactate synthase-1/2/3 large subunit
VGCDSFQEVYIAGITLSITKHNFAVQRVEDLADTLRRAFEIAQSGRKGPVLVDIPKDITAQLCEYEEQPAVVPKMPAPREYDWEEIADIINSAEKPFIYFGGGVRLQALAKNFAHLLKRLTFPQHTPLWRQEFSATAIRTTSVL